MTKQFILLGAGLCLLAVIIGAFGAHALKSKLSGNELSSFNIANQYHFYHALGLILVGLIFNWLSSSTDQLIMLKISGWLMLSGILLFSGSLYLMTISNIKGAGILTPIGGICFILSWFFILITIINKT